MTVLSRHIPQETDVHECKHRMCVNLNKYENYVLGNYINMKHKSCMLHTVQCLWTQLIKRYTNNNKGTLREASKCFPFCRERMCRCVFCINVDIRAEEMRQSETDIVIYAVVVMWYIPDALQSVSIIATVI